MSTANPANGASLVKQQLTAEELDSGVAYATEARIPAGTRFNFAGRVIQMAAEAYLVFVDRQPMANWGHSCRYLAVGSQKGETQSWEARFPPFGAGGNKDSPRWRIVYRAPSVPDAAIKQPLETAAGPDDGTTASKET